MLRVDFGARGSCLDRYDMMESCSRGIRPTPGLGSIWYLERGLVWETDGGKPSMVENGTR